MRVEWGALVALGVALVSYRVGFWLGDWYTVRASRRRWWAANVDAPYPKGNVWMRKRRNGWTRHASW